MKYIIKCITGRHSKGDFNIVEGQALEVSKEIYDYFNNTFGASGNFNFEVIDAPKKSKPAKKKETSKETKIEKMEVKDIVEDQPKD